jgi:hypothetical protein
MTDNITSQLKKLNKKFREEDLEWRVQQSGVGKKGPWAMIVPYITNRAIIKRLNESVGAGGWQNEYKPSPCGNGYMCGISIKVDGEWVTKWDGSEITGSSNIDNVKSTASTSMKRAAVQWGIGTYLYDFEVAFADCKLCENRFNLLPGYDFGVAKDKKSNAKTNFQWKPKPIEAWALPVTDIQISNMKGAMKNAKTLEELQQVWKASYKLATSEDDDEMMAVFMKTKEAKKLWFSEAKERQEKELNEKQEKALLEIITMIANASNESTAKGIAETQIVKIGEKYRGEFYNKAVKTIRKEANNRIKQLKK